MVILFIPEAITQLPLEFDLKLLAAMGFAVLWIFGKSSVVIKDGGLN